MRKEEFTTYEEETPPPDRFLTFACCGTSLKYPQVLIENDLLAKEIKQSDDPNVLYGTPCCPGIVENTVCVAKSIEDTKGLNGTILVKSRTDPGWVPLYPACSGLLVERGSLLSHSAVVARELGLPTIVGIPNLMQRLKTGQTIRMDASKGEIQILNSIDND